MRGILMRGILSTSIASVLVLTGCGQFAPWKPGAPAETVPAVQNPLPVSGDKEFIWDQIVDTVDDYFRIEREQPPRQIGGVLTEGMLTTTPQFGATMFEPWRRDSTPGFERRHATLQSIRRQALVRVIPSSAGYSILIEVHKELEDLARPEQSTIGAAIRRHDGTLVRPQQIQDTEPATLGWISLGRDFSLEQEMLEHLRARLTIEDTPGPPPGGRPRRAPHHGFH